MPARGGNGPNERGEGPPPEAYQLHSVRRKLVDDALLANYRLQPALRKTAATMAAELGVPMSFITTRKRSLRVRGVLPPTGNGPLGYGRHVRPQHAPEEAAAVNAAIDTDKLLAEINAGKYVDKAERRRILSIIATFGTDTNKIQAVWKLEELDQQEEHHAGAPKPRTREERIDRLTRLNLASGREDASLAYERAFPPPLADGGSPAS